jgi:glutamyl-tRNA synthetase
MPGLKERAKTLRELWEGAQFLFLERPIPLDEKAAAVLDPPARQMLATLLPKLKAVASWQAKALEEVVRTFAEETGAKLGKVAQPLRAALTGKAVSPPVFDVMAVLGREEALARIAEQAA